MSLLLAIDPGPEQSALVWYDTDEQRLIQWAKTGNDDARRLISKTESDALAVEMIASYGMAVGASVFQTCVEIGRFLERWQHRAALSWTPPAQNGQSLLVYRRDVKLHLCGSARAKDANIRQALIDRYGGKERAIGKKGAEGPLHGLSGDGWAALAVACTVADTLLEKAA